MKKKMHREELINVLENLNIDKEEYWVLSTFALILRGIYEETADLDIAVTNKGLEQLKKNYNLIPIERGWYTFNDNIECICDGNKNKLKYQPEKVGNYYLQNIFEYHEFLKETKREKDKNKIEIVENYINNFDKNSNKLSKNLK